MRISVAKVMVFSLLLVVLFMGIMFSVLGAKLISTKISGEIREQVTSHLNVAKEIYSSYLTHVRNSARMIADSHVIRGESATRDNRSKYKLLKQMKEDQGLDFLVLADQRGTVTVRVNNPGFIGDSLADNELVKVALATKKPIAATEIVPTKLLQMESSALAQRAYFASIDPHQARVGKEAGEPAGMAISAAAPVFDFADNLIGVIYAGLLLNRNYEIVDRIQRTLRHDMKYQGKEVGNTAIFQHHVRIATSIPAGGGSRAVGTPIADNAYEKVIIHGIPWIEKTFAANGWYITAYEPIKAVNGKIVGILGVGLLEEKYSDLKRQMMLAFFSATAMGLVACAAISYFVARTVSPFINRLTTASKQIARGEFDVRVEIKSMGDLGALAHAFNSMASALKERDEKLKEFATRRIMESERLALIGQLAAGVAHEVNNPLQGILSYSFLLVENLDRDDPNRELIEKIATQATRCKNIIRGLLDFSRQTVPEMKDYHVNLLVSESLALVERQSLFHNIEIVKKLDPDLPSTVLDPSQIQQVLMNIIINAAEAMEGQGRLTISTRPDPAKKFIEIEIADTGAGISKENLEKIFDPFFTTKDSGHGTGLGLAISYGIVKKHGGTIQVKTELGKGSTFTVRLPIIEQAAKE